MKTSVFKATTCKLV